LEKSAQADTRIIPWEETFAMTIAAETVAAGIRKGSHYIDVDGIEWAPSDFPGIESKVLMDDPVSGIKTILFRLEPGAVVPDHIHTGVEMTYVIEGSLEDEDGACSASNFVWREANSRHEAVAPNGAGILGIFTSPNVFAGGQKFFTDG